MSTNKHCMLGLFDSKPTVDNCLSCDRYEGNARGLGDVVTKVIKKTGLDKLVKKEDCGCAKRRGTLNKLFKRK